jgi:hypothetical protein
MSNLRLHPSEKELLLFVDGELRNRQATRIERHLAHCWQCRAQLAQTEHAINEFVTLRRKLLDQQFQGADFPSSRSSRALLGARIAERAGSSDLHGWRKFLSQAAVLPRPLWSAGSLVALVLVLLLIEPLLTPSVAAMDVIAHGRAAEQRRPTGIFLRQRVRINVTEWAKPASATLDYDVWKYAGRSRMLVVAGPAEPADRLRAFYQSRGADWENPLSVTSFARLRDSLGPVRDEVRGREQITVTSTPVSGGRPSAEVRRLELTVRRSDWHAISQRIELPDADYELTEVLDEAVARDKVDPAIFAEPPLPALTPAPPVPPPRHTVVVPPRPLSPTVEQLEDAEIQLREALHQIWADVEEVPEIRKQGDRIHVRLYPQTAQRKQEVLTVMAGIPHLDLEISDAQTSETEPPAIGPAPSPPPALYSTQPPLAKALREYSGGLEPANNYLNAVRDSYLEVLVEGSALARLAERYADPEWDRLSPELQQRLKRIAADHVAAVRTNLRNYLRLVSPVLDEMASKQQVAVPKPSEGTEAGCAPWQTAAQPLVEGLRDFGTAFRRLFVEERTEAPVTVSVRELLSQSLQLRTRLQQQLCQP